MSIGPDLSRPLIYHRLNMEDVYLLKYLLMNHGRDKSGPIDINLRMDELKRREKEQTKMGFSGKMKKISSICRKEPIDHDCITKQDPGAI